MLFQKRLIVFVKFQNRFRGGGNFVNEIFRVQNFNLVPVAEKF